MIVDIALVAAGALIVLLVGSVIQQHLPIPPYVTFPLLGAALTWFWYPAVLGGPIVLGVLLVPVAIIVLLDGIRMYRIRKSLSGGYGESTRWASEIIQNEDDDHFVMAVNALPQEEIMEVGIVADSKEEMRELIKERFEEMDEEQIPEDFA